MGAICCEHEGNDVPPPSRRHPSHTQGTGLTIGPPQDVMILPPRNQLDQFGVRVQLVTRNIDRDALAVALKHVASFVAKRGEHVKIMAVGGAVSTLYLRSREATHDVDIFGSDFNNQDRMLLDEALKDAQRHSTVLGTDWINTETQMWMPGQLHRQLTESTRQQDVKIFDEAGLNIYAAPWGYSFSGKINRLLTGGDQSRPYDLLDAVTYLHEYIHAHGDCPSSIPTVLGWERRYQHETTEYILRERVNTEY